jgi:uncharacterized protein (TIGR00730 family)|tara:strand:+ start:140 stop:736 length:597 start_codon:yes stop_codon:yes gene_type:complete
MKYKKIGVMCGSSNACPKKYLELANALGKNLAEFGHDIVYGGGAKGLMRQVADGAISMGGNVIGYMPQFMTDVEWQHPNLSQLFITTTMAERKHHMMQASDATLFLPGGCGTMEEFFEWLSAKRLGMYTGPLIIFNFDHYYDPLIELLKTMEKEKFHNPEHNNMWSECTKIDQLKKTLEDAPEWSEDSIHFASVRNKT